MYNIKDIQFAGKHDYNKESAIYTESGWNKTFSVGVFKWVLKGNGKSLKKSKAIVRVSGLVENKEKVFEFCENVVKDLDANLWDGRKSIKVK